MYLIYKVNSNGRKEYFTGKTKIIKGNRIAVVTKFYNVKNFRNIQQVFNAKRNLETRCKSQAPFEVCTMREYLRERGLI